jgi:type VI secretion system protein ImpH
MKILTPLKKNYRHFEWLACLRALKKIKLSGYQYFFKSAPNLAFPGREIADFKVEEQSISITANFLGLQGAATPLPLHFTELIVQDDPEDSALNDFFNFFNQRFYEALLAIDSKYHYLPQVKSDYTDPLSKNLQALAGLPKPMTHKRQELYWQLLPGLRYWIGGQPSKQGLCLFLQRLFQVSRVALQERVKKEIFIPQESQNILGVRGILGDSIILGRRVYQASTHLELHIYLLRVDIFLPGSTNFLLLQKLLRFVLRAPLWVTLVLHAKEACLPVLNTKSAVQLGYTSVLLKAPKYKYCVDFGLIK